MLTSIRSVLALCVVASACYKSPVPISTEAVAYDAELVGTWQIDDSDSDQLSVLQFDNGYYYIEMPWNLGRADTTRLRARAYLTNVDGSTFVNVQDIQGEERAYTFYKLIKHSNRSVTLIPLKDMPRFATPNELATYLRSHLTDSAIYDNEARFRKVSAR